MSFHHLYADLWKDRGTGSAHQRDREHLTLKISNIPAELCIHLLHMRDKLLALSFSFCLESWGRFVLVLGCELFGVVLFLFQFVKPFFWAEISQFCCLICLGRVTVSGNLELVQPGKAGLKMGW